MGDFDSPFIVFAAVLAVQWLAAYAGDVLRRKTRPFKKEGEREDFDIVRTASLTLLGLIIGFSFAMALSRYDQRKNLEEAEANAIGTEYLRANLLPADDASRMRELLKRYCDERVSYYVARDNFVSGRSTPIQQNYRQNFGRWSSVLRKYNRHLLLASLFQA